MPSCSSGVKTSMSMKGIETVQYRPRNGFSTVVVSVELWTIAATTSRHSSYDPIQFMFFRITSLGSFPPASNTEKTTSDQLNAGNVSNSLGKSHKRECCWCVTLLMNYEVQANLSECIYRNMSLCWTITQDLLADKHTFLHYGFRFAK